MKTRSLILIIFLGLSISPLVIVSLFSSIAVRDIVSVDLLDDLESIANLKVEEINDLIDQDIERLLLITSRTQLRITLNNYTSNPQPDLQEEMNKILVDAIDSVSSFKEIFIVNNSNVVLAGTNQSRINEHFPFLLRFNQSNTSIHIENFFLDDELNLGHYLIGPLFLNNVNLGTLVIHSTANNILTVVENYTGLGKTGESFLIQKISNQTAQLITSNRFDSYAALNKTISIPDSLDYFSNDSSNKIVSLTDYRNKEVLLISEFIEKTGWSLIVKIDKTEVFQPVNFLENFLLLLNILSIFVVIIASLLFSKFLSSPITKVSTAAKKYSQGDLKYRINVKGTEEFNLLVKTMNEMALNLDTAQSQLEKTLIQLYQSQKMEAIGRLAGGIAHDFNNLLSIILGYCELAEDSLDSVNELNESLLKIKDASLQAKGITGKLLVLSKKHERNLEPIDLNIILTQFLDSVSRLIPEFIDLKIRLDEKPCYIIGDKYQIEQILLNLVLNSKESITDAGEIIITVKHTAIEKTIDYGFSNVEPGSYIELIVRDTGVGIEKENITKIFEPFWTTKENGTGLGMAIIYSIVRQLNGNINVESEINKGTTISLMFKELSNNSSISGNSLLSEFSNNIIEEKKLNYEENKLKIAHNECILVVDDNESIRDIITKILVKNGFKILQAKDTKEAIFLFEKNTIDILITDIIMPKMNGKDLAELLISKKPELKVIFITGYNKYQKDIQRKYRVLQKPFHADDLIKIISEL